MRDESLVEYLGETGMEGSNAVAIIERPPQVPALTASEAIALADDPYIGVAAQPFDSKAQDVLRKHEHVPSDWIEIKPNGQPYLGHIHIRRIFNEAFGHGGWAIIPVGDFKIDDEGKKVTLYRSWRLYVNGRYVDETVSAGEYWKNNAEQNYGDAAEACKSFAINRFSKLFNIAADLWNKQWVEAWKSKYAYRETDGKWRKKQSSGMDAGTRGNGSAATSRAASEGLADADNNNPTPSSQVSSSTSPKSAGAPASSSTSIRPVSIGDKKWKFGSEDCAKVTDAKGEAWTFVGAAALDAAKHAIHFGKDLLITVEVNKKGGKSYNNVTAAEVME